MGVAALLLLEGITVGQTSLTGLSGNEVPPSILSVDWLSRLLEGCAMAFSRGSNLVGGRSPSQSIATVNSCQGIGGASWPDSLPDSLDERFDQQTSPILALRGLIASSMQDPLSPRSPRMIVEDRGWRPYTQTRGKLC